MKYYIIVGEASGDLHASNLIRGLFKADPQAEVRFWGGDLMQQVCVELSIPHHRVFHYKETAVMGVWDVITHLNKIRRNFSRCRADIDAYRPDALILVDYAGFNLPMAKYGKSKGIKTLYYIAPKTWASKEGRVKKLQRYVDRMFTIMPFETEYFKRWGIDVRYCGNPVMDAVESRPHIGESLADFSLRNGLDPSKPKIALLAGSRQAELKYNLPLMLDTIPEFPGFEFVIAGAPSFTIKDYEPFLAGRPDVKVVFGETYQLVSVARCALVTSGTATLETAILNCPQVVIYKMWGGSFSDTVAHWFIKVPWISLVNLILNREAVRELFQKQFSHSRLITELHSLISDTPQRRQMLADYDELRSIVGSSGCSERAGKWMVEELTYKN